MKKILLSILILVVSILLAGEAMALRAKAPSPPANLCVQAQEYSFTLGFLIKPMGTIKMLDGPEKLYSIQGVFNNYLENFAGAVSGSGYMGDGSVFRFSINGSYIDETSPGSGDFKPGFFQADGYWDVVAKSGTMNAIFNAAIPFKWTLSEVPCDEWEVLY